MDRIFMDEYYEHLRADNIKEFSKERNDEYVGKAEEYEAAKTALLEGLGLEHLFDHSQMCIRDSLWTYRFPDLVRRLLTQSQDG